MNWDTYALIDHRPLGERGEDTFALNFRRDDIHTLAVFDGCGGSGAWKYPEFGNATGARVAAQTVSPEYLKWFDGIGPDDASDPGALARNLEKHMTGVLSGLKELAAPMGIVGNLVKSFPTTAACAVITDAPDGGIRLTALNAGDSRVYFLTPDGLVQMTRDDSRGNPDPLETLRANPPMSTMLNADKPFTVTASRADIPGPCAVMAATDGVFGYVRSPMHFEYMLLKALDGAKTVYGFEEKLKEDVVRITGDDSTCVMSFYGWKSLSAVQRAMKPRLEAVRKAVEAVDALTDREAREAELQRQWALYRKTTLYYEQQG